MEKKIKKKVRCCVIDCSSPNDQSYKSVREKKCVYKWIEACGMHDLNTKTGRVC